jgi:DNA-binding MarR family transcriptional regulator
MKSTYLEIFTMMERLDRLFSEVIERELHKIGAKDISAVQAMTLYNIGRNQLTIGELTHRGYYLGSNVSYNLRKMLQNHYVEQKPSEHDARTTYVNLSKKGLELYTNLDRALSQHADYLTVQVADEDGMKKFCGITHKLASFWATQLTQ